MIDYLCETGDSYNLRFDYYHSENNTQLLIIYIHYLVCHEHTTFENLINHEETEHTSLPIIITISETEYSLELYTKSGEQKKNVKSSNVVLK